MSTIIRSGILALVDVQMTRATVDIAAGRNIGARSRHRLQERACALSNAEVDPVSEWRAMGETPLAPIRHSLQLSAITKRDRIIIRPACDHLARLSW